MKLLLDEDVPVPLVQMLTHLLRGHQVDHVYQVGWGGKNDRSLYADAARRGYQAVLTNDVKQLTDPAECTAIQKSGLHHISYTLPDGLDGLAAAAASIIAAIRPVLAELENTPTQRLVTIVSLARGRKTHTTINPATDPPSPYWPGAGSGNTRRR